MCRREATEGRSASVGRCEQLRQVEVAKVTDGNTQPRHASTVTYIPVSSTVAASCAQWCIDVMSGSDGPRLERMHTSSVDRPFDLVRCAEVLVDRGTEGAQLGEFVVIDDSGPESIRLGELVTIGVGSPTEHDLLATDGELDAS